MKNSPEIEALDSYIELFDSMKPSRNADPAWLKEIRESAFARFSKTGFPTPRDENWKNTNILPLLKESFQTAKEDLLPKEIRGTKELGPDSWNRAVFVNGVYSPSLSSFPSIPSGVKAGSLRDFILREPSFMESCFSKDPVQDGNAFTALNTAMFQDGMLMSLPAGVKMDHPISLVFLSGAPGEKVMSHPRNVIVAERGSSACIIERYIPLYEGVYFTNALTQIVLREGSEIEHYKIQSESAQSYHIGTVRVNCEEKSSFKSYSIAHGAKIGRTDLKIILGGEKAQAVLNGLYLATDHQLLDHHTVIDHVRPLGTSHQLYKGIVGASSRAVFDGKIIVRKDAQKTEAHQTNKNLLLSEEAKVDTRPQLEIFADDVKCTHGAAVGQLDAAQLFYLQSRGIPPAVSARILRYGFAREVVNSMGVREIQNEWDEFLLKEF